MSSIQSYRQSGELLRLAAQKDDRGAKGERGNCDEGGPCPGYAKEEGEEMTDPWKGTALRKHEDGSSRNGGHRYAIQSSDNIYSWADAYRIDPISGDPEWFCDRGDHCEHKRKLAGWGILVDLVPGITLEQFRRLDGVR